MEIDRSRRKNAAFAAWGLAPLLPIRDGQKCAQALADPAARAVCGKKKLTPLATRSMLRRRRDSGLQFLKFGRSQRTDRKPVKQPITRKAETKHERTEVESCPRRSDPRREDTRNDGCADRKHVEQREVYSHPDGAKRRTKDTRRQAHDRAGGGARRTAQG